jgi:hypothetical protein
MTTDSLFVRPLLSKFRLDSLKRGLICPLLLFAASAGAASVGAGGQPIASLGISVPPGVAGMTPNLGLEYAEGATAALAGVGWNVQGISVITRCPATRMVDRFAKGVAFATSDKLCLNGQRLIQTDANGSPLNRSQQVADAAGLASNGSYREYRTETDSFSRVRAYGTAGAAAENGPGYFKVWTRAGQTLEFGTNPGGDNNAQVLAAGKTVVSVWALSRISDVVGNFVDFKYDQRSVSWGTGTSSGVPSQGSEWGLAEIQYAGNKVVLQYEDRPASQPADTSENYHAGSKSVSRQRLKSVTTYVNSPNTGSRGPGAAAVAVKTYKAAYSTSAVTGRSLLSRWQECAGGPASTKCLPATSFAYTAGRGDRLTRLAAFEATPLATRQLTSLDRTYGTLVADFNGDGRSDILRWTNLPEPRELWFSNGDGTFNKVPDGTFSLVNEELFRVDGCLTSVVQDVNGDGLPDIVRIPAAINNTGGACGSGQFGMIFINAGDGSFAQREIRTSSGALIPLNRITSRRLSRSFCGAPLSGTPIEKGLAQANSVALSGCRTGYGWTEGASFYLIDANGDGKLDIVTSSLAGLAPEDPGYGNQNWATSSAACSGCTKLYLANANGTFDPAPTNLANVSVYADPGIGSDLTGFGNVMDADRDGLPDLVNVGTPFKKQSWASVGDGNFSSVGSQASCDMMLDFNGDGNADCLRPDATSALGPARSGSPATTAWPAVPTSGLSSSTLMVTVVTT